MLGKNYMAIQFNSFRGADPLSLLWKLFQVYDLGE